MDAAKRQHKLAVLLLAVLVGLDALVWYEIVGRRVADTPELHFLDVGQGDATLLMLPGNVAVLTDAGPDRSVAASLEAVLPSRKNRIDIGIISHPQLDHFAGFNELIRRYEFGALLMNGRDAEGGSLGQWKMMLESAAKKNVPIVIVGAGDRIRHGSTSIEIIGPSNALIGSGDLNDTGIIERIETPEWRAILTADIGMSVEKYLLRGGLSLRADIMKIGHHGSKYSSSVPFLAAIRPRIIGIEVGARNRHGHPSPETLLRIASTTHAKVFRTDESGTISITGKRNRLRVTTAR